MMVLGIFFCGVFHSFLFCLEVSLMEENVWSCGVYGFGVDTWRRVFCGFSFVCFFSQGLHRFYRCIGGNFWREK